VELEECLSDVLILEQDQVETVAALHQRARIHLRTLAEVADEPDEKEEVAQLTVLFDTYIEKWNAIPPRTDPNHDAAFREARRLLETDVLRQCHEVEQATHRRLDQATLQHERVLQQLAWGMAGVAVLGAVAGLVLGFGVARGLSRSIHRLQVRIRDAAGKLAHTTLPDIVFIGESGFEGLHEQIDRLTSRIEQVVRQLQEREREVLRAEQLAAVGQLAAGVGHEIRNPLTAIKMLVQTAIAEGSPTALTTEDLQVIEEEVRRIEHSLKTFLDFARPPKAERRPVDLLDVLRAVTGLIRGRAERQRVAVRLDAPAAVTLTADPGQLRQVLLNLCLNAMDAMPAGGELQVRVRAPAGEPVAIEVADTGTGIPPNMMQRLFTPFASSKDTGLGLGLVISKRIVEDHGGEIGAANRPGRGATFFVRLPRNEK
jgi:signal transduction histidine kinase